LIALTATPSVSNVSRKPFILTLEYDKGETQMTQVIRNTAILFLVVIVSACAGYRDFYTKGSNAFHDITIEVSPELQKAATLENVTIVKKPGEGHSFVVSGDIQYGASCKTLFINTSFINTEGVILHNAKGVVMPYVANTKARFQASAYIVAMVGETKDIVGKVVLSGLECY
jgi:hypothetical protein